MHYLLRRSFLFILFICYVLVGCNFKPIQYPYAENNTSTNEYFGVTIADDYEWLESQIKDNSIKANWLRGQRNLCSDYFSNRDTIIRSRIEDLAKVPHYRFIDFINDTLYYYRVQPYSNVINLYRFTEKSGNSEYLNSISCPFVLSEKSVVKLSPDLKMLACLGKIKGGYNTIYLYDITQKDPTPIHSIPGVANFAFFWNKDGIIYMDDPLYNDEVDFSINRVSMYNPWESTYSTLFEDSIDEIATLIDFNFDHQSNSLYLGKYSMAETSVFQLEKLCIKENSSRMLLEIPMKDNLNYRIGGVDDKNAYIIGIDAERRGELLGYSIEDNEIDTLLERHWMPLAGFSQMKDHVLAYFQDFNANRAYIINKKTKKTREIQLDDSKFYTFLMNKSDSTVFFQEETHISPRYLYKMNPTNLDSPVMLGGVTGLPFDPDDYVIEYKTVKGAKGNDVNLTVSYKKGMKRDGSNPVFLMSFLNAENSYLDQFHFSRILYMDQGFVFVQRCFADSRTTISLDERIDDLEAVIHSLIEEDYSSPKKIAVLGREYGGTALMSLMNRNPELGVHGLFMDGIFDLVRYHHSGKLLFQNNRLFNIDTEDEFMDLLKYSPYHNVQHKANYPSMLFMVSLENNNIAPVHTYKMAAQLQMRTKGKNPIIMYAPHSLAGMNSPYNYKDYIEHGICFLMKNMNIAAAY